MRFTETGEERQVRRGCKICGCTPDDIGEAWGVISESGVIHKIQDHWAGDTTVCGKDATRGGWWWPE